jgi:hypothetical protein
MEGSSYLLAQYRLAPVQVLTMNNGLTSGLPTLDYYVSRCVVGKRVASWTQGRACERVSVVQASVSRRA